MMWGMMIEAGTPAEMKERLTAAILKLKLDMAESDFPDDFFGAGDMVLCLAPAQAVLEAQNVHQDHEGPGAGAAGSD